VELFKKKIESAFSGVRVSIPERYRMTIIAGKDEVISILNFLKGEGYNHLGIISCVDWPGEGELELVYILSAYMRDNDTYDDDCKANIILKTRISREKPEFATAINVFENAEPYEREIHEFFGLSGRILIQENMWRNFLIKFLLLRMRMGRNEKTRT